MYSNCKDNIGFTDLCCIDNQNNNRRATCRYNSARQRSSSMNLLMNNLAEVKITYSSRVPAADRIKVRCSQDANQALRLIWPSFEHREYFYIMLLNRANQILGFSQISMGGISGTVTDVRIIFQTAIKANASGLLLAHNHPSSALTPSEADISITRKIKEAGKFLDISVLDHLILCEEGYLSLADDNLMPV